MGCGKKAAAEDEDDWYDLCKRAGIKPIWGCYSQKAHYAKEGFDKCNLRGDLLNKYVDLRSEINALVEKQRNNDAEYKTYLALKEKFEP